MFDEIIKRVANDKRYLPHCFKITEGNSLYQDLWHETILTLYKYKEHVIEANNNGYLEAYVIKVINNLWHHRRTVKKYKGSTSNLYMYSDNLQDWSEYKESLTDSNNRELVKKAVNELHKKMRSNNDEEADSAELAWKVCNSNVWQVSLKTGINHMKIKRTFVKVTNQIKRKLDE